MAYSFHKYWNYNDQESVDWVLEIPQQYNVPLWMGEGGENSNVWFHDAIALLEENEIGWSFWPMKRIETTVGQYSILFTDGYKDVLAYWRGEGPQPTVTEAYDAMMELAINANSLNCLYRKDVWDAQIRQVNSNETKPFSNHTIPGVVFMPDYDLGKLNQAYYDVDNVSYSMSTGFFTAWNSGWHYRNDGVDIEPNNDPHNSNGYHIGFINKDEWTNYTVQIAETAAYTAKARVASEQSGGKFHLAVDGEDITETHTVSSTGGWTNFVDLEITDVLLNQGEHVVTLWFDDNTAVNMSSIEFIESGTIESVDVMAINGHTAENEKSIKIAVNQTLMAETINNSIDDFTVKVNGEERAITSISSSEINERTIGFQFEEYFVHTDNILVSYDGTTILSQSEKPLEPFTDLIVRNTLQIRNILPKKIQAEDFHYMEGLGLEETSDIGGGYNIGYTNPGDYADYLIYAPANYEYKIKVRLAAQNAVGSFGFYLVDENQEETELCIVQTPVTGGWQTWETVEVYATVPKGAHTLRMRVISQEFNMNWFEFVIVNGVDDSTGDSSSGPRVYPNPINNGSLFIDFGPAQQEAVAVQIYSITGKLFFSNTLILNNGVLEMNISSIPKGIYILDVLAENKTFNYKIFIQ